MNAIALETGEARRTWLRGLADINKRYRITAAARNLGVILRKLFGLGKPRCLQGGLDIVIDRMTVVYSLQVPARPCPASEGD